MLLTSLQHKDLVPLQMPSGWEQIGTPQGLKSGAAELKAPAVVSSGLWGVFSIDV